MLCSKAVLEDHECGYLSKLQTSHIDRAYKCSGPLVAMALVSACAARSSLIQFTEPSNSSCR